EARSEDYCAGGDDNARTKAVNQNPEDWGVEGNGERDEREAKRNIATTPAECLGERFDKNTKRASDENRPDGHSDAAEQHHPPAVEYPWGRDSAHNRPLASYPQNPNALAAMFNTTGTEYVVRANRKSLLFPSANRPEALSQKAVLRIM